MSQTQQPQLRLIDALPSPRNPKKMEVLILGMPRTGVSSLRAALNTLGYTTFHGSMMNKQPHLYKYWTEAITLSHYRTPTSPPRYTRSDFDKLLGDYNVSCNLPGTFVWEDLIAAYPEAKVILTCRDVDKWITSMKESVDVGTNWKTWDLVAPFDPAQSQWWAYQKFQQSLRKHIAPNGEREAYLDHYAAVRAAVPKDRLLEFDVKKGWGELCEFLGDDIPEERFPHVNDREGFMLARTDRWWRSFYSMISRVLPPVTVGVAGALGWWFARF